MSENPNDYCRVCNCNFKVQFGVSGKKGSISFENIYKPSERKDSLGVVLANVCQDVGIPSRKILQNQTKFVIHVDERYETWELYMTLFVVG